MTKAKFSEDIGHLHKEVRTFPVMTSLRFLEFTQRIVRIGQNELRILLRSRFK